MLAAAMLAGGPAAAVSTSASDERRMKTADCLYAWQNSSAQRIGYLAPIPGGGMAFTRGCSAREVKAKRVKNKSGSGARRTWVCRLRVTCPSTTGPRNSRYQGPLAEIRTLASCNGRLTPSTANPPC